jgi:membrane peptidoglycan carboxypeptidase
MWSDRAGGGTPVRVDLQGKSGAQVMPAFSTELGIGQYGITVLDHANGMATFAAGGKRAEAHFVRSVTRRGEQVYGEKLAQTGIGLNQEQINELDWTLRQVAAAKLDNGWDVAGKTGTWQLGNTDQNAHTWMVGYTGALAAAVWLGTTDGKGLTTKDGAHDVSGAGYAAPIWRQFMVAALDAMKLDKNKYRFGTATFPNESPSPAPSPTPSPSPSRSPVPSNSPSATPSAKPSTRPSASPIRSAGGPPPKPSLPASLPPVPAPARAAPG